jgi:hypothetical protein
MTEATTDFFFCCAHHRDSLPPSRNSSTQSWGFSMAMTCQSCRSCRGCPVEWEWAVSPSPCRDIRGRSRPTWLASFEDQAFVALTTAFMQDGVPAYTRRRKDVSERRGAGGENLFLRKQLALYLEYPVQPRRATHTTRSLVCPGHPEVADHLTQCSGHGYWGRDRR